MGMHTGWQFKGVNTWCIMYYYNNGQKTAFVTHQHPLHIERDCMFKG